MRKTLSTALIATLLFSGCGFRDSSFNPLNWFGRSQEVPRQQAEAGEANPLIPNNLGIFQRQRLARSRLDLTTPIDTVTDVVIERVPGGAIIRATGLDAMQGTFDVELVPEFEEEVPVKGVLTYTLERQRPAGARPAGTVHSREVTVARKVTNQTLAGVKQIRIVAAQNARAVRRR